MTAVSLETIMSGHVTSKEHMRDAMVLTAERDERTQRFFEDYAASIVAPHVGEERKTLVREMLKLAETAGLYNPSHEAT
jgi:hypothetical protein